MIYGMPIWFIVWMLLSFAWLGYETNWLTVRLSIGATVKKRIAQYAVLQALKGNTSGTALRTGTNDGTSNHPWHEVTFYKIFISPGVNDVLCGWEWLDEHCADLVDYKPTVQMLIGGVRYTMHINAPSIIKDIMKANKLTKQEKRHYALAANNY